MTKNTFKILDENRSTIIGTIVGTIPYTIYDRVSIIISTLNLLSAPLHTIVPTVVFFLYMSMLYTEFYPSSIFDIEQSNVTKLTSDLGISSIFGGVFL